MKKPGFIKLKFVIFGHSVVWSVIKLLGIFPVASLNTNVHSTIYLLWINLKDRTQMLELTFIPQIGT